MASGDNVVSLGRFDGLWASAPHTEDETLDLVFSLAVKDVEEFMTSADFEFLAAGPGEGGITCMYFKTIAANVPILFEEDFSKR